MNGVKSCLNTSSETQGQIEGAKESLDGWKKGANKSKELPAICPRVSEDGLSMSYMLLGCSFKTGPTIHSRALSIAASGMIITLSTNGCSHSKNQFDKRKQD